MNVDNTIYLDTSTLAKWYINEQNSNDFSLYIQQLDVATISSLTCVKMRSLLARRRIMNEIEAELKSTIYAAFQNNIYNGHLDLYQMDNSFIETATEFIGRYSVHPLKTPDVLPWRSSEIVESHRWHLPTQLWRKSPPKWVVKLNSQLSDLACQETLSAGTS